MTENEALRILQNEVGILCCLIETDKKIIADFEIKDEELDEDEEENEEIAEISLKDNTERKEAFDMAIAALKEVKKYRKIGTVEECKELASMVSAEKKNALAKIIDEWKEYIEIGTVEECREAVEKQKPKEPRDSIKINPVIDDNGAYVDAETTVYLICPNCGETVGINDICDNYCRECGQAINWKESE